MHLFFSTLIWTSKIDNYKKVNEELLSYIYSLKEIDPLGKKKSNINGWHSNDFNLNDNTIINLIKSFEPHINLSLKDMNWDLLKQEVKYH